MPLDPNAFARGFETTNNMVGGIANSFRQGAQENALRTYAMNPNDPNAVNALAQNGDPRLALQVRQQQQQSQAAKQEKDTAMIASLARDAKDPATFDAAVDQVVAMGYPDAAQFKGKFSPSLRSALMAAGGIKDDVAEPTSMQRDYQFLQGKDPALAAKFLTNRANPPRFVPDGNGGFVAIDPGAFAGGLSVPNAAPGMGAGPPAVLTDDDWDMGGPTPQASGTFRP